ncbi:MAG: MSHA bioproteinis protein MshP [Gallionellaceae bacterium]|nr:MAG: MSHA bioproteinis protein MshP [Gallionellaceae bacterium]
MKNTQKGFSIISAIFLLVVLSFLGVAMVTFSTTQHQTVAMDVMGSRAYQAARAGVDWGAYQVLRNGGACAPTTTLPVGTLAGTLGQFDVSVTCGAVAASEVTATSGTVTVYSLSSTATFGTLGQPSYVERQIQITIAQ